MRGKHDGYESVQAAILGTAAQLFTRAGIHGTSLNDIAQAAGLSKGTLYYILSHKGSACERHCPNARRACDGSAFKLG